MPFQISSFLWVYVTKNKKQTNKKTTVSGRKNNAPLSKGVYDLIPRTCDYVTWQKDSENLIKVDDLVTGDYPGLFRLAQTNHMIL